MGWTCKSCLEWFDIFNEIDGEVRFCPVCCGPLVADPETEVEDNDESSLPPEEDLHLV